MTLPAFQLSQPERLYMGGRWVVGHGGRTTVVSPHNAAAYRVTRSVRTGTMSQNALRFEQSGVGREGGREGLATYTGLKAIILQGGQLS